MEQATERDQMRELYLEMVNLNGTYRNKAMRRMSAEQLQALVEYADTTPPLPFSTTNPISSSVRQEQARRTSGGRQI